MIEVLLGSADNVKRLAARPAFAFVEADVSAKVPLEGACDAVGGGFELVLAALAGQGAVLFEQRPAQPSDCAREWQGDTKKERP